MEMTFADFIREHDGDDPVRLLLSRDRFRDIDLDLAVSTLEVRRRLRAKVPEWYAVPSLVYPFRLSGEQCSSSETAKYKAMVCRSSVVLEPSLRDHSQSRLWAPPSYVAEGGHRFQDHTAPANKCLRIADLTGGMGVDSWAFAQVSQEVLYNEVQPELARATELNFRELGLNNVRFRNERLEPGKVAEVLDGFQPDVIFLDPARRAEDGRKVFLIEDCQPDVAGLLPELFAVSRFILLKLSPMADITMACKRLSHVREVHAVAAGGECKELLFLLDRDWSGPYTLTAYDSGCTLSWTLEEESSSVSLFPSTIPTSPSPVIPSEAPPVIPSGAKESFSFLFEPGKALAKAGAFRLLCARYGLTKLGVHTHLYVAETIPEELKPFGKYFEVLEVLPLNNRTMKEVGKRYPLAEVTARNVPMTSETLRKKLGCRSGGDVHLFGVRIDAASQAGNYLIITKR